jgi:hypothetical protein
VPFSEPIQSRNERQEIEAQNVTEQLLEELFGGLEDSILSGNTAQEDKRKELYTIAASVFA